MTLSFRELTVVVPAGILILHERVRMEHLSSALPMRLIAFTDPTLIGRSSPPPDQATLGPMERIRALRSDPALRLSFTAITRDGITDIYADDQGYRYHALRTDGTLVEVDRREGLHSKTRPTEPETRLTVHNLRTIAVALVETQRPTFEVYRSTLHPFEGNRDRELYLFRWEDFSQPLPESSIAPYVEVGLYPDGQLASYVDTLEKTKY